LSNREYFVSSRIDFSVTCIYACTPTHIHTCKTFFYAIRKFYFVIKRRQETIIAQNEGPAPLVRSHCICNKLPTRLATSMAWRPHLVTRLH